MEALLGELSSATQRRGAESLYLLYAHDFESNVVQMWTQFVFSCPILDISFVQSTTCFLESIPDGFMALDCGVKTMEIDIEGIGESKALIGNGPMGDFVISEFEIGTTGLMDDVLAATSAATILVFGCQGQQS